MRGCTEVTVSWRWSKVDKGLDDLGIVMPAGHTNFRLRGGVDHNDFPAYDISLKDVRAVGRIAWEKWGHMVADKPIRDLISLVYAEGLYHGAMIGIRTPELRDMIGSSPSGDSSAVAFASSSETTATETPSVRDPLDSL